MGIGEVLGILFLLCLVAMDICIIVAAFQTGLWLLIGMASVFTILLVWFILAAWFPALRVWIFS